MPANHIVFKRGDKPEGFYIVFKGKVNVLRPHDKKGEEVLIWLVAGDYFGEEALVENRNRSATITAVEDTTLLFLTRAHFEELLVKYSEPETEFSGCDQKPQTGARDKIHLAGTERDHLFCCAQT